MAPTPDEKTYVEIPFIQQLKGLRWEHVEGDIDVPYLTERESFRKVLLKDRLRKALREINRDDERRPCWLWKEGKGKEDQSFQLKQVYMTTREEKTQNPREIANHFTGADC